VSDISNELKKTLTESNGKLTSIDSNVREYWQKFEKFLEDKNDKKQ